jgi:hypothetical protein
MLSQFKTGVDSCQNVFVARLRTHVELRRQPSLDFGPAPKPVAAAWISHRRRKPTGTSFTGNEQPNTLRVNGVVPEIPIPRNVAIGCDGSRQVMSPRRGGLPFDEPPALPRDRR